jgi:hypothetical protein
MSKDFRRRITRLEKADSQRLVRYEVSDKPIGEDDDDPSALSPVMKEEEWYATYCGDDARDNRPLPGFKGLRSAATLVGQCGN